MIVVVLATAGERVCRIARAWDRIGEQVAAVSVAAGIEQATGAWALALEVEVALEVPEDTAGRVRVPPVVEVLPACHVVEADLAVVAVADLAVAVVAVVDLAVAVVAVAGGNKL